MTHGENIKIALRAIKSQTLRTVLTVLIIAFGIMALVGILTSIDAIQGSLNSSFSSMGSNSFTIRNSGMNIRIGKSEKKAKRHKKISYYEANDFCKDFKFQSVVSVSTLATPTGTLKFKSIKTNPNVTVMGADVNYLEVAGYLINQGRNFSPQDLVDGNHVCILGKELVEKLFPGTTDPIDQLISVGGAKYRVIGTLQEKGSSMGFGGDKICVLPLTIVKQYYATGQTTYSITVKVADISQLEPAVGEATGLMRNLRKDPIGEVSSFEITKSDSLSEMLFDQLTNIRLAAIFIGAITLLGAAIGLMNIMLVSVTERTREIGIRKSLGATQENIRKQFLTEAIVICQIGGMAGVLLGILIGNLVSTAIGGVFIIPWNWMLLGFSLCFIVGLLSGIYPAIKAAKLDPIEALRYE